MDFRRREHTEVRVLRPRKKFVLLPFSFLFSYNTIDSRRKKLPRLFTFFLKANLILTRGLQDIGVDIGVSP